MSRQKTPGEGWRNRPFGWSRLSTATGSREFLLPPLGYIETMAAFGFSLGDGHIGAHTRFPPTRVRWTGILLSLSGSTWTVR